MKNRPLVSIIIAIHNSEKYIEKTLDSVFNQTYRSFEVIVVDYGSTDNSTEIINNYLEIRYFHQEDQGIAVACNTGISVSKGELITFLNAGDQWPTDSLSNQVSHLTNNPLADISQGMVQDIYYHNPKGKDLISEYKLVSEKLHNKYLTVNPGSAIYRRSTFDKVGLFNNSLKHHEHIDWFVRAWDHRIIKSNINEVTLFCHKYQQKKRTHKNIIRTIVRKLTIDQLRQKNKLNPPDNFASLSHYISLDNIQNAQKANFSIISNDCWGGFVYESFGMIYASPFIGTRIQKQCYIKLLMNLREYLESPLEFSKYSRYEYVNTELQERYFPIGRLSNSKDDIEIHFYHEVDEQSAKSKWERRLKRIQWDNIFVKFSDYWEDDFTPFLEEFESFNFSYKICFTSKVYPDFLSAFFIPGFDHKDACKLVPVYQEYFDLVGWLNKLHGNNINAYRIKSVPK